MQERNEIFLFLPILENFSGAIPWPRQDIVYIPRQHPIVTPLTVPRHEIIIKKVKIEPPIVPNIFWKATIGAFSS